MSALEPAPEATVVIATRDRRDSLRRTLAALSGQVTARPFDVVVVDDGSEPPVSEADLPEAPPARLIRGAGAGPARARNLGIDAARGGIVAFTDDDTVPDPGWLEAACAYLGAHPGAVGVEGPIVSLPYDRLYELSLESTAPGAFFTANVAYRREVLERVRGFDDQFPYPHCEDLDLAYRAKRHGSIGYAEAMRVVHVPRPISIRQTARRGRYVASELELLRRHPERYGRAAHLPGPVFALSNSVRYWIGQGRAEGRELFSSPRRALRFAAMATSHIATTVAAMIGPAVARVARR